MYRFSMTFFIVALTVCLTTTAHIAQAGDITKLSGYSPASTLETFALKVKTDHGLYGYLARNTAVSQKVLQNIHLQSVIASGAVSIENVAQQLGMRTTQRTAALNNGYNEQAVEIIQQATRGTAAPLPRKERAHTSAKVKNPKLDTARPRFRTQAPGDDTTPPIDNDQPTPESEINYFDVNASQADGGFSANGWPTHLNVPESCPPPQQGITYYHENRVRNIYLEIPNAGGFGPTPPVTGNQLGWNQILPFHRNNGFVYLMGMTDVEQFAIPFHTANTSKYRLRLTTIGHPVPQGYFEMIYAHCPGDFSGTTPENTEPLMAVNNHIDRLNAGILASIDSAYPSTNASNNIVLRPNTRYFLNVRPVAAIDPNHEFTCDHQYADNGEVASRNGHKVCWRLIQTENIPYGNSGDQSQFHAAPYAGACLTSPPYPENYNSETCGESRTVVCTPNDLSLNTEFDLTCYDVHSDRQPQRFVRKCSDNTLTWTMGYNKPAYSTYMCELSGNQTVPTDNPAHANYRVCAAHREGQLREVKCSPNSQPAHVVAATSLLSKGFEQCVFDPATRGFRWIAVEGGTLTMPNQSCFTQPYDRPLANIEGCRFDGQTYPLGTQQTISCRAPNQTIVTEVRTCQPMQIGSEGNTTSSTPLFVRTQGAVDTLSVGLINTAGPFSCIINYAQ